MATQLITIATYNNIVDAQLAKSQVESEGIPCFLKDENMTGLYSSLIVGGVKLQVPREHVQEALEILGIEKTPDFNDSGSVDWQDEPEFCPICNTKMELPHKTFWEKITDFFAGKLQDKTHAKYVCPNCGYEVSAYF